MERKADIAIVGAGIVGLAHAYMALRKGYRVVLFEREQFAVGASVRNFGLLWSIGQEPGVCLDRSIRSLKHWQEVAEGAGFWLNNNGSLHVAYHDDELNVLEEFMELHEHAGYDCTLLSPSEVRQKSGAVKASGLKGGLYSTTESTVYAREAVRRIPLWMEERFGLILRFGHVVTGISLPQISTAREQWTVDKVFVCSGADFETLYPHLFDQFPVVKCKLQMMKAVPQRPFILGPTLCAGLTLRHYPAFGKCKSLIDLDQRYDSLSKDFKEHGVHVLLAQNAQGELIIGDSHHYSRTVEPFDSEHLNNIILDYLGSFTSIGKLNITERWHGVYPKIQGASNLILTPEPGVTIVTGLGGAGMTMSFGLAEELIERL
ncbi:MAG: TIGR03364 family FAD-dependent oxidoreductase [Chryseolinea sp.]